MRACKDLFSGRTVTRLPTLSASKEELVKKGVRKTDPFIIDYDSAERVAGALAGLERSVVLEMNPGCGVLTRALLNAGAASVVAMEHRERHFFPVMKALESEAGKGRLSTVYCKWSRVDAEADPSYPSSLTSRALLSHLAPRDWDQELVGYVAGVKAQTHVKGLFRFLLNVLYQDSLQGWGRWGLAWLCDWKAAQVATAGPGSPHYGRLSIKAQTLCHVDNPLSIPCEHVYPQRRRSRAKKQAEQSPGQENYHLLVLTPRRQRAFNTLAECEHFHDALRQLTAKMRQPLAETLLKYHFTGTAVLKDLGILPGSTPHSLTPQQFCSIIHALYASEHPKHKQNLS